MLNRHIKRAGVVYYRLDKQQARKVHASGETVYATNCNKGNANHIYPIIPLQSGIKFDLAVMAYKLANCNGNTYPAFYVIEKRDGVIWDSL